MLKAFKRRIVSSAVAMGSLLPQVGRVSFMGTQASRAPVSVVAGEAAAVTATSAGGISTGAAVAGAGAAGVTGGAVVSSRGCGRTAVTAVESAGTRRTATGLAGGAIRSEGDDLARVLASRNSPLRLPGVIATDGKDAARAALASEEVVLFDATGRQVAQQTAESALIQREAVNLVDEVIRSVPVAQRGSEKAIAEAFERATRSVRAGSSNGKLAYEFDLGTGKIKLKYPTARGEISGEFNAIDVAKKATIYGGGLYYGYYLQQQNNAGGAPKPPAVNH